MHDRWPHDSPDKKGAFAKEGAAAKTDDGFVQPPFIAKSQANNAYAHPDSIVVVQHLLEECNGPGPNADVEGALSYPLQVRAFLDKGLAEQRAGHFAFERARMMCLGQSEWDPERRGKELQGYLNDTIGWEFKMCTKNGTKKETVWVQEVKWDQNRLPYGRTG